MARVFEQKMKALINDLKLGILGKFVDVVDRMWGANNIGRSQAFSHQLELWLFKQ